MEEVRWGIIGCGDVTEVKSGPAFNKVPHSRLVAVMRRDAEKAADYAKRHRVPRWYDNADDLIHDPEINAIYVATPPNVHAKYTIAGLKAGKPVYVEKPMAMNAAECAEMVRISKETGTPLYVAYYRRAMPYFLKIKEIIDSGDIGEVKLVAMKLWWPVKPEETEHLPGWRVDPSISGGGHFHDLAAHQFDFLEFAVGSIRQATGISRNQSGLYTADDIVVANFEFESGALGSGSWCFSTPESQKAEITEIIGDKGKITFSFFSSNIISLEREKVMEQFEIDHPKHVHQPLIELVVKSILGQGNSPSTGESAMRTTEILDSITGEK